MSHTPTPWRAGLIPHGVIIRADKVDGQPYIAQMLGDNQEANAEFVVRAVNAYERLQTVNAELLESLEKCVQRLDGLANGFGFLPPEVTRQTNQIIEIARLAVAHAKEKP